MTWELFRHDSPYRLEIEALADGAPMSSLPLMKRWASEALFTPTAERRQEGDHSLIKRFGFRNCSGPYISLILRLLQIERLCKTPDGWRECTAVLRSLNNPLVLAERLGLQNHLDFKVCVHSKCKWRDLRRCLAWILYGLDIDTQFQPMTAEQKKRKAHAQALKTAAHGTQPRPQFNVPAVRDRSLAEHVQSVLKPGKLYSAPLHCFGTRPLGHENVHVGTPANSEVVGPLEPDVSDQCSALALAPGMNFVLSQHVFFRVFSTRPSRGHFVEIPAAAGDAHKKARTDMCLTFHRAYIYDGTVAVNVRPIALTSGRDRARISIGNVLNGDLKALEGGLRSWTRKRDAHFILEDEGDQSHFADALKALHSSGAYPHNDAVCCAPVHNQDLRSKLFALERRGCVEQLATRVDSSTEWRLTTEGVAHLGFAQRLVEPSTMCEQLPLDGPVPDDATEFQLLGVLQRHGWQVHKAPKKVAIAPYVPGQHKIWYISGVDLSRVRSYMLCLARSASLTNLTELHHLRNKPYYVKILNGNSNGALAIQDIGEQAASAPLEALELDVQDDLPQPVGDEVVPPHIGAICDGDVASDGEASIHSDVGSNHSFAESDGGGAGQPADDPPQRIARRVHHKTTKWGPFLLTFRRADDHNPFGGWQARCPYHCLNAKTKCTWSRSIASADGADDTRLLVMRWCLEAQSFDRKRLHGGFEPTSSDMLLEALMHAQMQLLPEPPSRDELVTSLSDEVLDMLAGEEHAAKRQVKRRRGSVAKSRPAKKQRASASVDAGSFYVCSKK